MQISQKNQLNKNVTLSQYLDLTILILIFSSPILNILLLVFNIESQSGQLSYIYMLILFLSSIIFLINFHWKIKLKFFIILICFLIILLNFSLTVFFSGYGTEISFSEYKLFLATIPSIIFISYYFDNNYKTEINFKLVFIFDLILTLGCYFAIIYSDGLTSSGLVKDSSGFIYQNISYYASYGIGLTIFILSEYSNINFRFPKTLFWILSLFQFLLSFISGGRGGLILGIVLYLFYFLFLKNGRNYFVKIFSILFISMVIIFLFPLILRFFNFNSEGYERVTTAIRNGIIDKNRLFLWGNSWDFFTKKPIFGNGIGTIFYKLGTYSHNFIFDILAETGIIGLFFLLIIIFRISSQYLANQNPLNRLMAITFLCGITLNLFSGYIWVNQQVILPLCIISLNTPKRKING